MCRYCSSCTQVGRRKNVIPSAVYSFILWCIYEAMEFQNYHVELSEIWLDTANYRAAEVNSLNLGKMPDHFLKLMNGLGTRLVRFTERPLWTSARSIFRFTKCCKPSNLSVNTFAQDNRHRCANNGEYKVCTKNLFIHPSFKTLPAT